jgi:hypothetical protein
MAAEAAEATAEIIRRSGYEVKIHDKVNIISVLIDGKIYYADIQPVGKYGPDCKVKYRFPGCLDIIGTSDSIKIFQLSVRFHGKVYDKQKYELYLGRLCNNRYLDHNNAWARSDKKIFMDIIDQDFMPVKDIEVNIKNEGDKFVLNGIMYQNDFNISFFVYEKSKFAIAEGKYSKSGRDDLFRYVDENGELFAMLLNWETSEVTLNSATRIIKLTSLDSCAVVKKDGLYNGYLVDTKNYGQHGIHYYNYTFFTYCAEERRHINLEARSMIGGLKTKPAAKSTD